ncbi:MAG: T9SS type A sorting domain-containing protein, partial [Calditrichaeota bacterium]|nr:T9SS type A sorting domain-containing protein [Calditrichota bacterium]
DPGTTLSYSAASDNGDVQVTVQNNSLTVNFVANAFGSALITVTANDGNGLSVDDQFNLDITPVNDPPVVAGIPNIVFPQDSSATLDLDPYADDVDNSDAELAWTAAVINAQNVEVDTSDLQINIDPGTHVATFTVTPDSSGKFTVVFTASDPGGLADSDTMIVTVSAVVLPFVLNPIPNKTYAEDSGPHIAAADLNTVFFNPNPADPLSYSAVSDNPDIQVNLNGLSLGVDFSANYFGIGNVIVTATTSNSFSVSDTFRVTVISVNDLPVISGLPDTVSFSANSSTSLAMWDYVADIETADPLLTFQFTASNDSLLRNFKTDTGELILLSLGGFSGTVDLGIFVTDGDNATVSDTIQVVIEPLVGIGLPGTGVPAQYALEPNYPNPFNPNTVIRFQLPEAQEVRLTVYSILGQKVRTLISERLAAGYHQAVWDGLNERGAQMSSGMYIYRLEAGKFQQVRKMILLK